MFNHKIPLAERMRPKTLADLVGQEHLFCEKCPLNKAIASGNVPSMILWGPPGIGKTTVANIIAQESKASFNQLSAIDAGVKEVRAVINKIGTYSNQILFIDEIHRFNKGQQDALLGAVEKGKITLIGATTENPGFEINSALLSRCQVYTLKKLKNEDLDKILNNSLKKDTVLNKMNIEIMDKEALFAIADGDGRKLLNILEMAVDKFGNSDRIKIDAKTIFDVAQQKVANYDKKGEMHYDIISAFIKSVRGSDPNAAVYYLARMIQGGEDLKFIARRLLILASEDIGNANPTALVMATNTFQAVNVIGHPESEIILSQCTIYLACSQKSNASYKAIKAANKLVRDSGNLPIPLSIRNAPTSMMKGLDYGKGYKYAHNYKGGFVATEFLPEDLAGTKLYEPADNPREQEMRKYLKKIWSDKYGY
ncbi:MAG TPA: replication-associated recombination protein A [Cyclobacteriaceae bacterium]